MPSSLSRFSIPRSLLATVGVVLGLSVFASAAQACSYPNLKQAFATWGDTNPYELAPDGGFEEGGNGWTFLGGAQPVAGNEDFFLNSPSDATSLSIPFGGLAISPRVCVDDSTTAFRLMARNNANPRSKLLVVVTYELPRGLKIKSSAIRASDTWGPSDPLELELDGEVERVARISFTPKDWRGSWLIDDLYIDPFARH